MPKSLNLDIVIISVIRFEIEAQYGIVKIKCTFNNIGHKSYKVFVSLSINLISWKLKVRLPALCKHTISTHLSLHLLGNYVRPTNRPSNDGQTGWTFGLSYSEQGHNLKLGCFFFSSKIYSFPVCVNWRLDIHTDFVRVCSLGNLGYLARAKPAAWQNGWINSEAGLLADWFSRNLFARNKSCQLDKLKIAPDIHYIWTPIEPTLS